MSAGLSGSSKYSRIALFVLLANGLLLIVSYASPYWTTSDDGHSGLWLSCYGNYCYERWNQWVEGWVRATQFMMSIGLTCWVFSVVFQFFYIFHRYFDEDKRMVFLSAIAILISGVATLLSVLTWAGGEHYGSSVILNWAYIISCFVTCVSFFVFYVLLLELRSVKV